MSFPGFAFDAGMEVIHRCSANPYQFPTPNGGVVQFFLRHRPNLLSPPSFDNCRSCRSRVENLGNLSGSKGQVLMPPDVLEQITLNPEYKYFKEISQYASNVLKSPIDGIEFVTGHWVCDYLPKSGKDTDGKYFLHFACRVTKPNPINDAKKRIYNDAIRKYIFEGQFYKLIQNLLVKGEKALTHVHKCLQRVHNGVQLIPAMDWLCNIYEALTKTPFDEMSEREKVLFQLRFLFAAGIEEGAHPSIGICPYFESSKNIQDFLDETTKHLEGLIKKRLDGDNYRRSTVEPSREETKEFMRVFPEILNTVLKVEDLPTKIPDTLTLPLPSSDPIDRPAVAAVASAGSEPPSKLTPAVIDAFNNLTTCKALFQFLHQNPYIVNIGLEVYTKSGTPCYIAESNVPRELLKYPPFLWAYLEEKSPEMIGIEGKWAQIHMLVPMYKTIGCGDVHRNILIIPYGATLDKVANVSNCCFAELFTSKVQHLGRSLEWQNKINPVRIPSEPHAVGLAACQSTATEMTSDIIVRIVNTLGYCRIGRIE